MIGLVRQVHAFFIPDIYTTDEHGFRKARILVNTSLITAVFALNFLGLTYILGQTMQGYGLMVCSVAFAGIPFLLRAGISRSICANIFVTIAFVSTCWDIYWYKGLESPESWWLCMTPVVAVFLNDLKSTWVWLSIALVTLIIVGLFNIDGHIFPACLNEKYLNWALFTSNLGLVTLMTIIAVVMEMAYIKSLKDISEKKVIIEREKERSDKLLLNILPEEVAEELKSKGSADAKLIDQVTVLFTDFKGFTQLSEQMSPHDLVAEINACFSVFDNIMQQYGVEKIKTIGDAYMAAGGLPTPNETHAMDVVNAALAIQKYMAQYKDQKIADNQLYFEIRIGIHTGPVVAGIVGIKKFQYDIWGDTVNTASRMESGAEVGQVNISGSTYELVKDRITCTHRGKITAKGKGEIDMYFVG